MKKLTKMPIDVEALLSSNRLEPMKDFQRWWYIKALLKMWNQNQPGYLENNGQLWKLLDSHAKHFFHGEDPDSGQPRCAAVVGCFQIREVDGRSFLYSPEVEKRWQEQQAKYQKKAEQGRKGGKSRLSTNVSINGFAESIWKAYPQERRLEKPKAIPEIEKAIERLVKAKLAEYPDRFGKTRFVPIESEVDAAQFLEQSVAEYRESPKGRNTDYVPYPERWFKREKYLEPRSAWFTSDNGKKLQDLDDLYGKDGND